MSPEQIRGTPAVSYQTDLYALGVLLYRMLAGKPPFEGNSRVVLMHYHLNEPPPRPSTQVAEIPGALDDLVVSLMAKAPEDRPRNALAVMMILTELLHRPKAPRRTEVPTTDKPEGSTQPGDSDVTAADPSVLGINFTRPSDSGINLQQASGLGLGQADSIELAPHSDESIESTKTPPPSRRRLRSNAGSQCATPNNGS
jgi:serine/threonine protein kinase